MLVVRIELWPHGDEDKAKELGRVLIANVGGTEMRGDYLVNLKGRRKKPWRTAKVLGFPRRSLTAYHLLLRALDAALNKQRNGRPAKNERAEAPID